MMLFLHLDVRSYSPCISTAYVIYKLMEKSTGCEFFKKVNQGRKPNFTIASSNMLAERNVFWTCRNACKRSPTSVSNMCRQISHSSFSTKASSKDDTSQDNSWVNLRQEKRQTRSMHSYRGVKGVLFTGCLGFPSGSPNLRHCLEEH